MLNIEDRSVHLVALEMLESWDGRILSVSSIACRQLQCQHPSDIVRVAMTNAHLRLLHGRVHALVHIFTHMNMVSSMFALMLDV